MDWKDRWEVPSNSDPDKKYTVAVTYDGIYGCTCPAWKFQKLDFAFRKPCAHIKRIKAQETIPNYIPPKQQPVVRDFVEKETVMVKTAMVRTTRVKKTKVQPYIPSQPVGRFFRFD